MEIAGSWAIWRKEKARREADPRFRGRKVVSISGDGGFGQHMAEIVAAVKFGMNITRVLLNDNQLGKISKEQLAGNREVWRTEPRNPDFTGYARLRGAKGNRVSETEALDGALGEAFPHDGPSLVEILTDFLAADSDALPAMERISLGQQLNRDVSD